MSLNARAWWSVIGLAVGMGALVFGPAGTIAYWRGWLYFAVVIGASAYTTLDLIRRDPALLERRLRGGPTAEREPAQRVIMAIASVSFIGSLVVPALGWRFGWSVVPAWLSLTGDLLVATGFAGILRVYRENTYTAATVQVAEGQSVISTGPYAVVRHPMYAFALLYLAGTPLALGSYVGFLPILVFVPVLVWRLVDEERLLARDLRGYDAYLQQVRYRLVPRVW